MSYLNLITRTTDDLNSSGDINQLMVNCNYILEKIYDELLSEIEMFEIKSVLCDPLNIPSKYLIADGSTIPSNSEAYIVHNSGGTINKDSYVKVYTAKGKTNIPDVLGQHLRYYSIGRTTDPDRKARYQYLTGTLASDLITVTLPKYYINIIKYAIDKGFECFLGEGTPFSPTTSIWATWTWYRQIIATNQNNNTITLASSGSGTPTAGVKTFIMQGDIIGSFQTDAIRNITGYVHGHGGFRPDASYVASGAFAGGGSGLAGPEIWGGGYYLSLDASRVVPTGSENKPKNIALMPLVRVYL